MDPAFTGASANLAVETTKGILQEAIRHVRYVIKHKEKVEKFEEKMKSLIAKRQSVQQEVDAAERNVETIKADIKLWCERVDKTIADEEKKVKDLQDQAKAKCFIGLCPNIKTLYKLSRKAEEDFAAFDKLLQDGHHFNKVAFRDVLLLPAPISAAPKNYKAFDSRKEVFEEIMEALKDSTIKMIGVYGVGGVGKTTLVNEVARQVQEFKLFNPVVKATVKRNPKIEEIQDQIAESLGLNLEEKSVAVRARWLSERLKKEKKVLIVLDDIWEGLQLYEVGIPFGDQQKGRLDMEKVEDQLSVCKILMTSRNRDVLKNEMDAQKTFPVGVVEEEEAWDLFKETAGNSFESPELRSVATEVAKRCAGLPLAISTVARALKNKDLPEWKDALVQLQRPSPENFTGIPKAVYSAIELSYNCLASEKLRQTFLLSCLLGNNAHIQDLLRCAVGLHLFDGLNTVEDVRNRILTMVRNLKDSCLLLDGSTSNELEDRIAMHDFVYDVALAIASRDNHAFVLKYGEGFEDWPDEEKMENLKWISLSFASIDKLPHELECPQLSLFSLGSFNEDSYAEMPTSFYGKMKKIKVLNLTKMDFRSLTSSISLPTSLRTLCLEGCWMGDMVNLGKLKSLEILSLSYSNIEMLPKEIGQMKMLRLLDLSYCTSLRIIPPGVLSSLSRLEELYIDGIIVPWNQQSNSDLDELKEFSCLTTLHIHILEAKIVPKDLFLEKLQRYKILVGGEWRWLDEVKYSRTLKLRVNMSIDHLDGGFKCLLRKAEALYLENLEGVKIVLNQMGNWDCFLHLNHLHIQNATEIEYIMIKDTIDKLVFERLRSLKLENLPHLISFCFEDRSEGSTSLSHHEIELPLFGEQMELPCLEELCLSSINVGRIWHNMQFSTHQANLTSLIIQGCGNLKYILSSSLAKRLVHLKNFEIIDCKSLREIILTEDIQENEDTIPFPQLSTLKLKNLQHLIGYCSENYNLAFPSLNKLKIKQCPEFKGFIIYKSIAGNQPHFTQAVFNEKVVCINLEALKLSSINVERIWHDQQYEMSCYVQSLKSLIVKRCHNLRCLFSSSMLPLLTQLYCIMIENCANVEEVISTEGVTEDEDIVNQILPNLTVLLLNDLPKLKRFCHGFGSYLEFPLLRFLHILYCHTFTTFITDSVVANEIPDNEFPPIFNEKVAFPRLEMLHLISLENCKKIWHVGDSFSRLNNVLVFKCNRLLNIFPFNMSERLQNLEEFRVGSCDSLKEIFEPQVLNAHELHGVTDIQSLEETTPNFVFPKLTYLQFNILPQLKSFYSKIHTTKWPSLKKMEVFGCDMVEIFASDLKNQQPLFWVNEVAFPNLEELKLVKNDRIRKIWHGQLRGDFFSFLRVLGNLTTLEVSICHEFVNLIPCFAAKSLVQLTRMSITDCDYIEEIVAGEVDEVKGGIVFTHLKYLELSCLPSLASFCHGKHNFEFPALEEVSVIGCPKMKIFSHGDHLSTPMLQRVQFIKSEGEGCWEGNLNATIQRMFTEKVGNRGIAHLKLSDSTELMETWRRNPQGVLLDFKCLKYLEVYDCSTLRCLFTLTMALDLAQLCDIKVKNCTVMEHIIADEGPDEEVNNKIVFPLLNSIVLESCGHLASFYHGSKILEFPSLYNLSVVDCPEMFAFAFTFSRDQRNELIDDGGNNTRLSKGAKDDFDAAFFNSKVVCIKLRTLKLSSINVERIWHGQPSEMSCCVQSLEWLTVENCHNLRCLSTSSMMPLLTQLSGIIIKDCTNIEEVISTEGVTKEETVNQILPNLTSMALKDLPKLMRFCHGFGGYLEFPLLRILYILDCRTFTTFITDSVVANEIPIYYNEFPPLFNEKVAFPHLEKLHLVSLENCKKIWYVGDSFSKLNDLLVSNCNRLLNIFPFNMSERLQNLEEFRVAYCGSLKEIFEPQVLNAHELHGVTAIQSLEETTLNFVFPKLTYLLLNVLPQLKSFYSKIHTTKWPSLKKMEIFGCDMMEIFASDSLSFGDLTNQLPLFWVNEVAFPNLEELKLYWNDRMRKIWHGLLRGDVFSNLRVFENLTTLEVSKCHEFVNLIPYSAAKSLVQLTRMSISDCKMIVEIIAGEGDEVTDCIVFSQLKYLQLSCLPSLSCFCLRDLVFEFPALEKLIVRECPKMKIFCQGDVRTPQLQKVMLIEDEDGDEEKGKWEGNLKTTIKQLFEEMNAPNSNEV